MSGVALVYSLFGSAEAARRVAGALVEEGLCACANRLAPCTSLYRWNGAMEEAQEWPVLFKVRPDLRDRLMARLAALHDYDVPAILALPVDAAYPAFAEWVAEQGGDPPVKS